MAKQNEYKKRLATASLQEAKSMDNAYTAALNSGKKEYAHNGLSYAVQPDKARVYASEIVGNRKPTAPIQPKTITSTAPVVVKKKQQPVREVQDTSFTGKFQNDTPKKLLPIESVVADRAQMNLSSRTSSNQGKPIATTMGGASNRNYDYPEKVIEKVDARTLAGTSNRNVSAPIRNTSVQLMPKISRPDTSTVAESTKPVVTKYGAPTKPKMQQASLVSISEVIGNMFTSDKTKQPVKINDKEESFIEKGLKAVTDFGTIEQGLRKYGIIDDSEAAQAEFKTTPKKLAMPTGKDYNLESVRDTVVYPIQQDKNNPANWKIDNNNPDIKARYSYVGNRAERIAKGTKDIPDAKVVSDFLLDESFESGYKHPYAKNYHKGLEGEPNRVVSISIPDGKGTYTNTVKPYGELTPEEKKNGKIKQTRTITLSELEKKGIVQGDDIKLSADSPFRVRGIVDKYFPIPGEPDTKGKKVPLSSQDKLGAFSGGAVGIAYKDKDGNWKNEQLNGSINQIISRAKQIKAETGADPTLMLADVGSFSNKPVANKNNVLTKEKQDEVNSYNTDDYGGAMEVLRGDNAKAYKFKGKNGARDTTVVTSNPNNEFVKKYGKPKYAMGGLIKKKKLAVGGPVDYSKYSPYMQGGAQAINMIDGMDGKPSAMGGIASGAMSGASMGMALGPMGALAGGVIGGGMAAITNEMNNRKEAEANNTYMKNLSEQSQDISKQTLRNYASHGVNSSGSYAKGGELPKKKLVVPTKQDSLDLYNNSMEVDNYYRGKKYTPQFSRKTDAEDVYETLAERNKAVQDKVGMNTPTTITNPDGTTVKRLMLPQEFHKPVDDNRFYQRENDHGIIDANAPMSLYDKRIKPQRQTHYKNENAGGTYGDLANVHHYDPIAVKPWQMMSAPEKAERVKRYGLPEGVNGIGASAPMDTVSTKKAALQTSTAAPIQAKISTVNVPQIKAPIPVADGKGQYIQTVGSEDARLEGDKGYTKYKVKGKVVPANQRKLAYGGEVEPEYEVERNEVVQGQPVLADGQQMASDLHLVGGERHENGGTDGSGGDRVFSDRIKTHRGGKTYAAEATKLGKLKGKHEDKMKSHNEATRNTGERMSGRINEQLDELFNNQEMKKLAMPSSISSSIPKLAGGGTTDPNKLKGFGVVPNPQGWGIDPRSGRPMNNVNQNGMYSQATDAFNNGTFLLPGETDANGNLNTYRNPVMSNARGSMYNTTVDNYIKPRIGSSNNADLTGLDALGDPNKYAKPDMSVTSVPDAGGVGTGKKIGGNNIPWQYVDNLANGIATANTPKPAKPYMDPFVDLNTKFDIDPQLSAARNNRDAVMKSIDANTAQSGVSNSNKQQLYASGNQNANELYAQKNNIEGELKNKEILVNSRINSGNNDKRYAYDNENVQRRAGISADYAANASNFAVDQYTSNRDAKMDARDIEVSKMIMMANPNSNTYGSGLKMVEDVHRSDPERAKMIINGILAESPNNPGALELKRKLGI